MKHFFSVLLALLCTVTVNAAPKAKNNGLVKFTLYGMDVQVHFDASKRVKVKKGTDDQIAKCVTWIEATTSETLQDCRQLQQEYNLNDWAYVKLVDKLSQTALGQSNEAVLLATSLLSRSGYGARVIRQDKGMLRLLYQTDAYIFNQPFFKMNDKSFYLYGDTVNSSQEAKVLDVCGGEGKPIDFRFKKEPRFPEQLSQPRTLKSLKNPDFSFVVQVNKNLVDFYGDMPSFSYDNNFMTRWSTIANYPLEKHLRETLIPQMKQKLAGKSQQEQVQELLWWMHGTMESSDVENKDCFLYGFDEDVWGYDRSFYCEETLFYPYCDTEDRSILLSRLIRDVVGVDVLFIYYPGHTAIAVCITDDYVKGAHVVQQGRYFVICDPSYLGSDVGEEMPTMIDQKKTTILLER